MVAGVLHASYALVVPSCPLCSTQVRPTSLHVHTDRTYTVAVCPTCGGAFTYPRPTAEMLADFYRETYFSAQTPFGYTDYCGDSLAAANAERMWGEVLRWAPEVALVRPRRLLDVGSATGELLAAAQQDGWTTLGVELSDWAADVARRSHGVHVVPEVTDVPEDDPFGLVTMFHVVEHLPDPVPTLQAVRRLISPDGLLAAEVPHWRSLGRLVRRASWSQLRPPEHINFLTLRSMALLLDRAGFVPVRMDTPYPHLHDRWRAARGTTRAKATTSVVWAMAAERLHVGGYLRVLARPV